MRLRRQEDRRTLGFVVAWFVVVGLGVGDVLPWWLLVPVASWLAFTGAVIAHNAVHVPVFAGRTANGVFQIVLTLVYGHPVATFAPGHNLSHHADLEGPGDVMRTSRARFRPHILNAMFFFWSIASDLVSVELKHLQQAWRVRSPWLAQFVAEASALIMFAAALILVAPVKFLFLVALPWHVAAWGIVTINLLQHDGCEPAHPYRHSRNFTGAWANWWLLNNGYHTMHHRRPQVHWADLPGAHAREIAPYLPPSLDQPRLLRWVFQTYLLPGGRRTWDGRPIERVEPPWAGTDALRSGQP